MLNKLMMVSSLALLAGCGSLDRDYVRADRATFDAVAPEYRRYIDEDSSLDDGQKLTRHATVDSWALRLEAGER